MAALGVAVGTFAAPPVSAQERPAAPRLFPEESLVYARIDNVMEMREEVSQSGVGRMFQDEQLKPLVGDLYLMAAELFTDVGETFGVSLDELLSIPQGEVAVAIVPLEYGEEKDGPKDESEEAIRRRIEERRNRPPVGLVGLVETGDKSYLLRRLMERIEEQVRDNSERTVHRVHGTDVIRLQRIGSPVPFEYAERDGTFIYGIGDGLLEDVLRRWQEDDASGTLAQNTDFANVMSHSIGSEATRPQLTFFADPYHFAERIIKHNGGGAALVWPILEQLQFDKIRGIGGSSFSGGEDEFESIMHFHLLLESPRDGLLAVVRPTKGPVVPEPWVPADLFSYTTLHWDLVKTYDGVGRIVARFADEETLKRAVEEPFEEQTGLKFREDVLEVLTGRVSIVRWNEPPMRINSGTQSWALETKDADAASRSLEKIAQAFGAAWKKDSYAGKTIYNIDIGGGTPPESIRRPEPAIALVDNYVIVSDSRAAVEHLIDALAGSTPRLVDAPEYALIAAEVGGKLGSDQEPFLFSYLRGEEAFRMIYEMATDPANRQRLREASENSRVAKMLYDALQKNQLPAFSAFSKYFAPSGAYAYDDATGLHYATFNLRPLE